MDRIARIEERLAGHKMELYEPVIHALGMQITPEELKRKLYTKAQMENVSLERVLPKFMDKAATFASDDVLRAFARIRLVGATAPHPIFARLISDFIIAVRQDVVGSNTTATGVEVFGARINDLTKDPDLVDAFTRPLGEVATKHAWTPPWDGVFPHLEAEELARDRSGGTKSRFASVARLFAKRGG